MVSGRSENFRKNFQENTFGRVILVWNSCSEQPVCNFNKRTLTLMFSFWEMFEKWMALDNCLWAALEDCFWCNTTSHNRNFFRLVLFHNVTLTIKFRKKTKAEPPLIRISMTTRFLQDLTQTTFNESIKQNRKLGSFVKNGCLKSNLKKITLLVCAKKKLWEPL